MFGRILLVMLVVVAFTGGPVDSSAASPQDQHAAGLGDYGPEGAITRDQLPEGLRELVRDESLTAANDPVFAAARAAWDVEADFVGQIDYQLEFRSKVDFMSTDLTHIAMLLLDRPSNTGSESMGLFMSDDEVTEMKRRDALGDLMDEVVRFVTGVDETRAPEGSIPDYGPNFGGIWQDQMDGGRIALAVVDSSKIDVDRIAQILGGKENLRIIEQPFTYNEIEAFRDLIEAELDRLAVPRDVAAVRSDSGRLLEVRVEKPATVTREASFGVPTEAYEVVAGEPIVNAGTPGSTHSLADQQPGLEIITWETGGGGSWCTWGFNGHTNNQHYIVLAGHCMPGSFNNYGGNWIGDDLEMYQNNDTNRNLTPGNAYLYSRDTSTYDAARISSSYADDNCYHGNDAVSSPPAHCGWPMAHRALHNSWEVGSDRTCASLGRSNTYKCGYIEEENHSGGNRVRVSMSVIGGDSGSGMKWDYRIDGVLTDRSTTEAFFQTAYHVQVAMGNGYFYFNCHSPGKKVYSDPADWGVCPSVDA